MNKLLSYCLLAIIAVGLTGCEEEDAALRFSTEYVSNTGDVNIEYYSPDPCCVSKMYWVVANGNASSLTLKCTDSDAIYFISSEDGDASTITSPTGQWTAQLINAKTFTLTFNKVTDSIVDEPFSYEFISIGANTKKGPVSESISVTRILDSKQPLSGR